MSFSDKVSRDLKLPYDICSGIVSSIRPQFSCPHKAQSRPKDQMFHTISMSHPHHTSPAVSVLPWALTSGTGECFNQHSPPLPSATLNQRWNRLEIAPYSGRMWLTLSLSLCLGGFKCRWSVKLHLCIAQRMVCKTNDVEVCACGVYSLHMHMW